MSSTTFSERDIERFLTGEQPEDRALAELMPEVLAWHRSHVREPSEAEIASFAAEASRLALTNRPPPPDADVASSSARSGVFLRLRYQMGAALAALFLLAGMTGVAAASDAAAPGDALYGLDRALEAIGINDGQAAERIAESQVLLDRGETAAAVEHAVEALEGEGTEEAAKALSDAAQRLSAEDKGENARTTLDNVAKMLSWMASTETSGSEFGVVISNMAKELHGAGPPSDLPGQSNGDPQKGSSENSGEPGRGNQGSQGPSHDVPGPPAKAKGGRP